MIKKVIRRILIDASIKKAFEKKKQEAFAVLKKIELQKGNIDPKLIKLSDEYSLDVFGTKRHAYWLYVYSAVAQEFKEGWIPWDYYTEIVVPKMKGDYGKIASNNALNSSLFNSELFPDLFYRVNSLWLSRDYSVIPDQQVRDILASKALKYVYKKDSSFRGYGVYIIDNQVDLEKIKKMGNGVMQSFINQHKFFDQIMPSSVATLRLTTSVDSDGNISLNCCDLRIGRKADTHVKTDNNIRVPINPAHGQLDEYGYTPQLTPIKQHPDSGFVFKNQLIPHFDKCLDAVLSLHKKIPFARIIGWDVTIDQFNTVQVMEWNGNMNAIVFSEATSGPIFKGMGLENIWRLDN